MRIGVIRGDMPGPVALMDLEPVSQYNPSIEPEGQELRLGRPNVDAVAAAITSVGVSLVGSVDLSSGVTINSGNKVLRVKSSSAASFSVATLVEAAYSDLDSLIAAVNVALLAASVTDIVALPDPTDTYIALSSSTGYLAVDTSGNGSTFTTVAGFSTTPVSSPTAAAFITATLPVGGPLDVSGATVRGLVGDGATDAQVAVLAESVAPYFIETDTVIKSFQVGMIAGFRSASYNPDTRRVPALSNGAAIEVVADDGSTPFTAPLTVISGAVASAGAITISGTNLGNSEVESTIVKVTSADGGTSVKLYQAVIVAAGGTVSATSIVVPSSVLNGLGVADSTVLVQYTSFASNVFTVT